LLATVVVAVVLTLLYLASRDILDFVSELVESDSGPEGQPDTSLTAPAYSAIQ
jgi:hypothetical protein